MKEKGGVPIGYNVNRCVEREYIYIYIYIYILM